MACDILDKLAIGIEMSNLGPPIDAMHDAIREILRLRAERDVWKRLTVEAIRSSAEAAVGEVWDAEIAKAEGRRA